MLGCGIPGCHGTCLSKTHGGRQRVDMQCSLWLGGSEMPVPSAHLSTSPDKGLPRSAESLLLSLRGALL